jgi:hypothetical protein
MSRDTITGILLGVVVFFGVAWIAVEIIGHTTASKYQSGSARRDVFMTEFMRECDDGTLDGKRFNQSEYCQCVWNKMETNHGLETMQRQFINLTEDEIVEFFKPEATACLSVQGL